MQKKGQSSWQLGLGAALIFLGAWLFGQYQGLIKLSGVIFIALGIGLIASSWK
ncbi:MAG: hypothetical protein AABX29_03045 [Nanoarchaeota archaeon]